MAKRLSTLRVLLVINIPRDDVEHVARLSSDVERTCVVGDAVDLLQREELENRGDAHVLGGLIDNGGEDLPHDFGGVVELGYSAHVDALAVHDGWVLGF